MKDKLIVCLLVIAFMLAILAINREPSEEAEIELSLYCEMVKIRKITQNPMLGWPAYKGIYDAECVSPGTDE